MKFVGFVRRNALFIVALILLTVGSLWIRTALKHDSGQVSAGAFDIGGSFTLTANDGKVVTEHSWPDKLLVMTFGYRYCPDICPTNLQIVASAVDLLGADGARVQPLFITIDPERDTATALTSYVAQFHSRLVGLTGTPEQIAAVTKSFRVYYRKVPGTSPDSYSMDHSAFTFVATDHGVVIKLFSHDTTAEAMASGLRELLGRKS